MKRALVLLAILGLPAFAVAQVNTLPSAPHLLVKGHAEVRYVPDRFTIHLDVDVTNMVPDVARRKVEAHIHQLLQALDDAGAMPGKTHASTLSIQPQTDYENDKTVFKGTEVSRSIDATFDSLDKLRAFIAKVPADKEVQIGNVGTARSDINKIESALRERAIANSREAATRMAAAYGVKIIGVYAVSDVAPDFAYGVQAGTWGNEGSPQTLQTITVTGSTAPPPPADVAPTLSQPALRVGTQTAKQDIYAVYLIAPKASGGGAGK